MKKLLVLSIFATLAIAAISCGQNDAGYEQQYRNESSRALLGKDQTNLNDQEKKALDIWVNKQKEDAKANNQSLKEYETSVPK